MGPYNVSIISAKSELSYLPGPGAVNRVGTWNVRTLLQTGSLEILLRELDRCKVSLVGISEMRWSGKGHFTANDNYTIYYSGNDNGGSNGVAFVANRHISKHVSTFSDTTLIVIGS